VLLANTLGNSGNNFPSSGVPSFAKRSCTGRLAKNFFLKKTRLCRWPLPGALDTRFFQKYRKTTFADGLCQGRSAENFFKKKIEKQPLPTAFARGARQKIFYKNIKTPLFADNSSSRPSTKKISKKC
jgi:hypothetical protein